MLQTITSTPPTGALLPSCTVPITCAASTPWKVPVFSVPVDGVFQELTWLVFAAGISKAMLLAMISSTNAVDGGRVSSNCPELSVSGSNPRSTSCVAVSIASTRTPLAAEPSGFCTVPVTVTPAVPWKVPIFMVGDPAAGEVQLLTPLIFAGGWPYTSPGASMISISKSTSAGTSNSNPPLASVPSGSPPSGSGGSAVL